MNFYTGSYADDMSSRRAMLICPTLAFASLRSSSPLPRPLLLLRVTLCFDLAKAQGPTEDVCSWTLPLFPLLCLPTLRREQKTLLRQCKQAQKKASFVVLKILRADGGNHKMDCPLLDDGKLKYHTNISILGKCTCGIGTVSTLL